MHEHKALAVDLSTGFYKVERLRDPEIRGPIDFGFREWEQNRALCFGGGPFMGSILPGSNRLMFTGHSPCWQGFYISTMGGAAHTFDHVGIDFVSLRGRCPGPSALLLRREGQEQVEVELHPLRPRDVWENAAGAEEHDLGFFALQRHLWERFGDAFSSPPRVLAVGPAALSTDFGAIGSSRVDARGLTHVDCWAGRGGLGSRMAQEHNLFGIVLGGSHIDRDFDDRKLADVYFKQRYEMRMILKDKDATRKYRYDPELETGGTLGVNFHRLKDRLFFFNYRSVSWSLEERLALHRRLIVDHYLRQFNEETIAQKKFAHCGEPCLAVCKKMWGPYKKDYEPYQTLGPNAGIFDQREAEKTVWLCDAMGFDAIQIGGVVSWLMELRDEGLLDPAFGRPVFEDQGFDPVRDSQTNGELARALVRAIIEQSGELDFQRGARVVARRIGERTGKPAEVLDRLVVVNAGERGWMVPNQYWVPGMFSPMPIMGKYFEYYGDDFVPPRTLGRMNAERMCQELSLDNMGFCRFHREWAEELVPEIYRDFWEDDADLRAHHRRLGRRINAANISAYYRSARVEALIHGYLRRKREEGVDRPELAEWLARFEHDRSGAARDFWYEIRKGVDEAFEGF
jgi:glyceraldehyde-3-phosphate dehydrogenase (ferredoxin)